MVCRRQKIGQTALALLRQHYWPGDKRITVGVLVGNTAAIAFYKAAGFCDYSVELELRPP